MPIRAENRNRYPKDWPAISLRIRRDRAQWQCEQVDYLGVRCIAMHGEPHPATGSKVVLTVAHLDHTPEHCDDSNLVAMCQRCHNTYDAPMRAAGIRQRAREALATPDMLDAAVALGGGDAITAALAVIRARFEQPPSSAISAAVNAREETGLTSAAITAAAKVLLGGDDA